MKYFEYHVHTRGSYRDAVCTVPELFERARELGYKKIAFTDHGNCVNIFNGFKYAASMQKKAFSAELKKSGVSEDEILKAEKAFGQFGNIKDPDADPKLKYFADKYPEETKRAIDNSVEFIPGVEMYTQGPENEKSAYHIILLAKDWEGLKAIFKVSNMAQLNKGGRLNDMPRVTLESLDRFIGPGSEGHGHVIGTSACMSGHLSSLLLYKYNLRADIAATQEKIDALKISFPSNALEISAKKLEELKAEEQDIKDRLKVAKALANKKVASKIDRLKAKIEKMQAKSQDTSVEEDELDALYSQAMAIEAAKAQVETLTTEATILKTKVATHKAQHAEKEKAMGPQIKLEAKIREYEALLAEAPDEYAAAKAMAQKYVDIFGAGNYFIELQNHGIDEEFAVEVGLRQIAKELNIPLSIANDVHFCRKEDEHKRNLIASMRFNKHISEAESQAGNSELYLKSYEEMRELFPDDDEAFANTVKIAEMCNVYYHKAMHLPEYVDTENGYDPKTYLLMQCRKGFRKRYPDYRAWDPSKAKMYGDRVNYELGIIHNMGFDSYIAIVEDFIRYGRDTYGQLQVGPGRGSGAGSLVCYLLGITDIDPMKYGLVFERFLNPERVSMPDIDTDFAPTIRDEVVNYVAKKYEYKGDYPDEIRTTVANIATEGTLAARGAIRSVGRVLYGDSVLSLCDKLAKLVPATPGMTLKKALEDSKELTQMKETIPEAKRIIEDAILVEGIPVNSGVHAAGVVITDKPVSEYAAMFWNEEKNCWVVQYDMIACEADLGILKMDFLGLKNLDIINDAINHIEDMDGYRVDVGILQAANDPEVLNNIYAKGKTNGVFQFESGGMKRTLRDFQPTSINDVILLNAAYRPGPMDYIPRITDVKLGKKDPTYIVPEMEKIMGVTYGSPIYQEQIMQLFQEVGFSLGQADIIRRAMSKKHLDEIEAAKDQFVDGMRAKGAADDAIEEFWQELLEFAKYA